MDSPKTPWITAAFGLEQQHQQQENSETFGSVTIIIRKITFGKSMGFVILRMHVCEICGMWRENNMSI